MKLTRRQDGIVCVCAGIFFLVLDGLLTSKGLASEEATVYEVIGIIWIVVGVVTILMSGIQSKSEDTLIESDRPKSVI